MGYRLGFHGLLHIGMNIGLMTAFVSNSILAFGTSLPVAVGGTLIPAITVLSDFMKSEIGPKEPNTVLMALAITTFCFGALVWASGKLGVTSAIKACPYAVFVGFLGYTGISLIVYAVNIVDPNFRLATWNNACIHMCIDMHTDMYIDM